MGYTTQNFENGMTLEAQHLIHIENGIKSLKKKEYQQGYIFFTVSADTSFEPNDSSNTVIDEPKLENSWCVLKLPTTYNNVGSPTKLCVFMHGSSGGFTNTSTSLEIDHGNNLVENGYAIMDVSVHNFHMADPMAISMYKKAIDYVMNNYNVENRIYLHGHSMGGWCALNFSNKFPNLIKVIGLWYPCIDAEVQGWNNTVWTKPKTYMKTFYNFSSDNYEEEKLIGYNPIKTNSFSVNDKTYTCLLSPIKIWHGQNDTYMDINISRQYVENINNFSGCAYLREIIGVGHEWSSVMKEELLNWFNRF